jgi:hypothetical protein
MKQALRTMVDSKNIDKFLSYLQKTVKSDKYKNKMTEFELDQSHPSPEKLYDFALGLLNEDEEKKITAHNAKCNQCEKEVIRIIQMEIESDEELLEWADKRPLDTRIKRWASQLWQPLWTGKVMTAASELPEQKNVFFLNDANIQINCSWNSKSIDHSAYLLISWSADIETPCQLSAKFVDVATKKLFSELYLGCLPPMVGEITFSNDTLGFDPTKEQWAISIILEEK